MKLENIFSATQRKKTRLGSSKHVSLSQIDEKPFYIQPTFEKINEQPTSKFILFSAPGATGKSALAKYISYLHSGLYWDLSKIRLGENSFHGTLMRSMETSAFTEFLIDFKNGKAMLIIDAVDEADMISGRAAVEFLLNDLIEITKDTKLCNIVLLARTETAKYIADYFLNAEVAFSQYQVGFFDEVGQKNFITELLFINEYQVTQTTMSCIESLFRSISSKLENEFTVRSFLGYAPVLQALEKYIEDETNPQKLINEFQSIAIGNTASIAIIELILDNLLLREQNKVIEGLKERCRSTIHDFANYSMLYTPEEQMIRLAYYVILGEYKYEDHEIDGLPKEMVDDYITVVTSFFKDHPFIISRSDGQAESCIDFTGPAFRDFSLSKLILNENADFLVEEYFNASKSLSRSHFPSQLFFDFYINTTKDYIISHHFPYIYDSFKSKELTINETNVQIISTDDDSSTIYFSLKNNDNDPVIRSFELRNSVKGLRVSQLSNSSINFNSLIYLGHNNEAVRISNSVISAQKIIWNANRVSLEAYNSENCILVSEQGFSGEIIPEFDIRIDNKSNLKISTPDFGVYYKLRKYIYDIDEESDIDITRFTHAVRSILISFRKHGKDTPAKHKDRIDNVVLAHSHIKHIVFEFLQFHSVIYIDTAEQNLYKMDVGNAAKLGISWIGIAKGDSVSLTSAYKAFQEWHAKSENHI